LRTGFYIFPEIFIFPNSAKTSSGIFAVICWGRSVRQHQSGHYTGRPRMPERHPIPGSIWAQIPHFQF